jgi:formate/nitrite transporter FocA (FNT family)
VGPKTKRHIFARLMQFFVIGVLMGIAEDLIAIHFATDAKITWQVVKIAFLVAFPFAIISELIADSKIFRRLLRGNKNRK